MNNHFQGQEVGRVDDRGRPIRCGDRVRLTVHKKGYVEHWTQDGWGRNIKLDRADWRRIPDRSREFTGVVMFSEERSAFLVSWDGCPYSYAVGEIGPPPTALYCIGKSVNSPDDMLEVLDS